MGAYKLKQKRSMNHTTAMETNTIERIQSVSAGQIQMEHVCNVNSLKEESEGEELFENIESRQTHNASCNCGF